MIKISASILSADFLKLGEDLDRVEHSGCDAIHIDVTDGHFVPNLTMGICVAEAVCKKTSLRKDVHLMISRPQDFIQKFADAGADLIIFHAEATSHPFEMIKYIRETGKLVGVALDPGTRVEEIAHYLHALDVVILVAVCVGFGGQQYIAETDRKIIALDRIRRENKLKFEIQVDGGINAENALEKYKLGADTVIAGSMVFNSNNIYDLIKRIKI